MATFHDHFSDHADQYARSRPHYPAELYTWLASLVDRRELAWDCATGNGQAARGLAPHFRRVVATDASLRQLAHRDTTSPTIAFHAAAATASALAPRRVDLITVAQALHWFELDAFEAEVRRVLSPGGVMVAWCYELFQVEPTIDDRVADFARGRLGPYWPPERRHVEAGYRTLELGLEPIDPPELWMRAEWTLDDLVAYVRTWSSVRRFREEHGFDPVDDLERDLEVLWQPRESRREVRWRMGLLAGRA